MLMSKQCVLLVSRFLRDAEQVHVLPVESGTLSSSSDRLSVDVRPRSFTLLGPHLILDMEYGVTTTTTTTKINPIILEFRFAVVVNIYDIRHYYNTHIARSTSIFRHPVMIFHTFNHRVCSVARVSEVSTFLVFTLKLVC